MADLFSAILSKTGIHIDVVKGYVLPKTTSKDSLVIALSVSGNSRLGGCWVHGPVASSRDAIKFKKILGIPTEMNAYKVIAYVAIGYALEQRRHPRPKLPLSELVYWEEFGKTTRPKLELEDIVHYEQFDEKKEKK